MSTEDVDRVAGGEVVGRLVGFDSSTGEQEGTIVIVPSTTIIILARVAILSAARIVIWITTSI